MPIGTPSCESCDSSCHSCKDSSVWCETCPRYAKLDKDSLTCKKAYVDSNQFLTLISFLIIGFMLQFKAYRETKNSDAYVLYLAELEQARRVHEEERDAYFQQVQHRQIEMQYLTERLRTATPSEIVLAEPHQVAPL